MIQRKILCSHDYLHIPVIPGGERNEMQIWAGGELVLSPLLALTFHCAGDTEHGPHQARLSQRRAVPRRQHR